MAISRSKPFMLIRFSIALAFVALVSACSGSGQSLQATNTPASSTTGFSQLVPIDLGIPQAALNSPVVGNVPLTTALHVVVTFKPNDPLLQKLGSSKISKTGPTSDLTSLANQLGITDAQYAQIKQFFGVQGASLNLSALHTSLTIDAPAGSFAHLLHLTFVYHQYQGKTFFAPTSPLLLPQFIAQHIVGITGLDSFSQGGGPHSMGIATSRRIGRDNGCTPDPRTVSPAQVRQVYGFNQMYSSHWLGQGTTIIVPEFNLYHPLDLQHYLNCVGFRGTIRTITVDHQAPLAYDFEPVIDLETIAGLAPAANIVIYQTDPGPRFANLFPRMEDVFNQILTDFRKSQAPVELSLSYGGPESGVTDNELKTIDSQLQLLSLAEHINVFVASGDCGAYDSAYYPTFRDVDFPGSDPYSITTGGTRLTLNNAGNRVSEITWSNSIAAHPHCQDNAWGSGGGLSLLFNRPAAQTGSPGIQNAYSNGKRQIPDLAALATHQAIYVNGIWYASYGTSIAAPIWASAYALANQGLVATTGSFAYGLDTFYTLAAKYANQHAFFDIQQGDNHYYTATPGWDYTTGLGSPNVAGLYAALVEYVHAVTGH